MRCTPSDPPAKLPARARGRDTVPARRRPAAPRDAVAERWLTRVSTPLAAVAAESGPTPQRLRRWFDALIAFKRRKAIEDPELFATYSRLVADSRRVVQAHIEALTGQLARIIADGMSRRELKVHDAAAAARAMFDATVRFHNPSHVQEWSDPAIDSAFEAVWSLLLGGLGVSSTKKRAPGRSRVARATNRDPRGRTA